MDWRFWEDEPTRVARAAARWRIDMEEPTSQAQVDRFEAWLRADPAHQRAYGQSDLLASSAQSLSIRAGPVARSRVRWLGPAGALAILAVALLLGFAWVHEPAKPAFASVTNRGTAVKTVTFDDGSVATLDTATTVEVAAAPASSSVRLLAGRVRLAVHLPAGRTLIILASSGTIVASDCVLDLAIVDDGQRILVISGQATLSASGTGQKVVLPPGQALVVREGRASAAPAVADDAFWTLARVSFDNAPLSQVLAVANRSGGARIAVGDPGIADMRVTAVLDLRDTRALARKLAAALGLRVTERAGTLTLSR